MIYVFFNFYFQRHSKTCIHVQHNRDIIFMKNFNRELVNIDISKNYNICFTRILYIQILLDTLTLFYSIEHRPVCFKFMILKIYFSYIFLVGTLKILLETTDIWYVGLSRTIKNVSLCRNNYYVFG